jgi:hypothetical protein
MLCISSTRCQHHWSGFGAPLAIGDRLLPEKQLGSGEFVVYTLQ